MSGALRSSASRSDALLAVVTTLVTTLLTYSSLRLYAADLRVPLLYSGDALPTGAHFKTVQQEGWYEVQPLLGAPWGQTYHDFPTADNLHMLAGRLLTFVAPDWAVAMNLYFLLGFPLAALTALLFLRRVGISRPLSGALAVLYAIAPYHFLRGESHLWLASYYTVPLAAVLLLLVIRGRPLWAWGSRGGTLRRAVLSPTARTLIVVALLASSSSYYAVFFLALLGCAGLLVLLRDRDWRRFWGAAAAGFATVVVMLLNMAPDLLFGWQNGPNPTGLERSAGEAEFYALKFAQLVLPWSGHRIGVLAHLRGLYDSGYVSLGEQPALGLVGAIGFVASFVLVAVAATAVVRRRPASRLPSRLALATSISALILIAFMFATLGGVSTLVSVFTSSLRGWNRMSIVIAILALAVIGLLLDASIRRVRIARLSPPRSRTLVASGLAVALLVVGYVDQTPGDADAQYAANSARYWSDDAFFLALEERLPDGAQVLVLPYIPFPESASESGMLASEQLVPYLHSDTISWSNGGIKGRPHADWPVAAAAYGADAVAAVAVTAGFDAVLVMRQGYRDNGVAVEEGLTEALGAQPYRDAQDRYGFYDLTAYSDELATASDDELTEDARSLILSPVVPYAAPDFGRGTHDDGSIRLVTGSGSGAFTVVNEREEARRVDMIFTVYADSGSTIVVTSPDGSRTEVEAVGGSVDIDLTFVAPPDDSAVSLSVTTPSGEPAGEITLSQPEIREPAVAAFLQNLLSQVP